MPDDFTCQGESAGAQSRIALYFIILLCLMPGDFTRQGERALALNGLNNVCLI